MAAVKVLLAIVLLAGCASAPFNPFPQRNADSRLGLIRNLGTTHLNLWIKDEAGRVIEEWYIAPARPPLSPLEVNQMRVSTTIEKRLPPGSYSVEVIAFYDVFFFSGRQRVDLPRSSASIYVGRDPFAVYDYRTRRHWGWVLEIHGGDRPRDPYLRGVNLNIRCC